MVLSLLWICSTAFAGLIKTTITCKYRVVEVGKIEMDLIISNTGDATAYNVMATIFLAGWAEKSDDLGDNPPQGEIHMRTAFENAALKPGKYTAVIRINFEEQSGRSHRVYHVFQIPYLLPKAGEPDARQLSMQIDFPLLKKKPFWKKRSEIQIFIENRHSNPIKPRLSLYLPDGFTAAEPNRFYELSPKKQIRDTMPVKIDPSVAKSGICHVVAWYEQDGIHYSDHIKGEIRVEESPIYFKWYLLLAIAVLALLFVVAHRRDLRGSRARPLDLNR